MGRLVWTRTPVLTELLIASGPADPRAPAAGGLTLPAAAAGAAREVKPHVVLVSTHDDGLGDLLRDLYVPCHFAETVGDDGLALDYRLRPGPATTRNAIALLRLHGAPAGLVSRALARAADLDPSYSPSDSDPSYSLDSLSPDSLDR